MTSKEFEKIIREGRKWLKTHGFESKRPVKGYYCVAHWLNEWHDVEIDEPGGDIVSREWFWTCSVARGALNEYLLTCGPTPEEALKHALVEYDKWQAAWRCQRFAAVLDESDNEAVVAKADDVIIGKAFQWDYKEEEDEK